MNTNIKSKKLISYKDLEKEFGTRVSPKCKKQLGDKIFDDYPQRMIKTARDALSSADLSPDQFERARRLLSNLSTMLDRAHDEADELNRLQ